LKEIYEPGVELFQKFVNERKINEKTEILADFSQKLRINPKNVKPKLREQRIV